MQFKWFTTSVKYRHVITTFLRLERQKLQTSSKRVALQVPVAVGVIWVTSRIVRSTEIRVIFENPAAFFQMSKSN